MATIDQFGLMHAEQLPETLAPENQEMEKLENNIEDDLTLASSDEELSLDEEE